MERFRAAYFGASVGCLVRAMGFIAGSNFAGLHDDEEERELIKGQIDDMRMTLPELPISRSLRDQYRRIDQRIAENASSAELMVMIREFYNNLLAEMSGSWFLVIRPERREFYEQSRPPFGPPVAACFPDAVSDIAAASRCFALDEWTACVFHAMRVLEHGLRAIAREVSLPADAVAHENWKNVIDQIERKIREMEGLPKSPEKAERLRVLSKLASEFRYFKDAWRNHVSHARANYSELDGRSVYQHVQSFMNLLAAEN